TAHGGPDPYRRDGPTRLRRAARPRRGAVPAPAGTLRLPRARRAGAGAQVERSFAALRAGRRHLRLARPGHGAVLGRRPVRAAVALRDRRAARLLLPERDLLLRLRQHGAPDPAGQLPAGRPVLPRGVPDHARPVRPRGGPPRGHAVRLLSLARAV